MTGELGLADVLSEFARTMVTDFPIQAILDRLVERIVNIMPVAGAGVTLITPQLRPRYVAASDNSALRFEELQTELREGPCVTAYQTGQPVAVLDLRTEDRFPNFTPRALAAGMMAVFTFPLRHGDHQLGALDLYRGTSGTLSERDMTSAQTLADVAAAYLLNAQSRQELQQASERSREAALHDALTGLANRLLLLERLEHAFLRSRRSGKTSTLFFIDLDAFKVVNDRYGHRVGDAVLVAVARQFSGLLRPGDTLARLSGDEFAILCEDLDSPAGARVIATRLHDSLVQPFHIMGNDLALTASVGIAFADREDHDPERLLHNADVAMYHAKRQGGARHAVFDLDKLEADDQGHGLRGDLPMALGRHELFLEYQPIVAASDGRITGVEAFLRWAHPTRGVVPPAVLIPLAERTGMMTQVGQWVLRQAWQDRRRWRSDRHNDDLAVSVNVSAVQLMSADFVLDVDAMMRGSDAESHRLTLEVDESVFLRDAERALVVLHDLRDLGIKLALDDAGYSSLGYLEKFPLDSVKVRQPSSTARLGRHSTGPAMIDAVLHVAHGLGLTVVAKGIETKEQYRELAPLGCDAYQGHHFARPMIASALDTIMWEHVDGESSHLPWLPMLAPSYRTFRETSARPGETRD
jgi:diguanylate cyclase (GGDEF)-like protein